MPENETAREAPALQPGQARVLDITVVEGTATLELQANTEGRVHEYALRLDARTMSALLGLALGENPARRIAALERANQKHARSFREVCRAVNRLAGKELLRPSAF